MVKRKAEYILKGDYHKKLDKKWRYYPIYISKLAYLKKFIEKTTKEKKILDVGCGEGILVEEYYKKGYNIKGIDLNYNSTHVRMGDIKHTGFKDNEFDIILCLDVIEHLEFEDQTKAINEIHRILKKGGLCLFAIPNLAHFASRIAFLFTGNLIRTSSIDRHKGDRPILEYIKILKKQGFKIKKRKGLFPTYPFSSLFTYYFPDKVLFLHKALNKFFAYPNWCFLNIVIVKK